MPHRKLGAASSIAVLVLLVSSLFAGVVRADNPSPPDPGSLVVQSNADRGLVFTKLAADTDGFCHGLLRVVDTNLCTHGPDLPPAGFDVRSSVAPTTSAQGVVNASATVPCDGDGTTGKRVEVLYVRASDKADRYATYLASFQQWAADADDIYNASAAETGGARHIRFVHDSSCVPIIRNVVVAPEDDDTFTATTNAVAAKGYNRTDRKYILFVDANVYCGIGGIRSDDRADASNTNNGGPSYGRTDNGCWSGSVPAHELMHNLGGVQLSAPNTSGGYHCVDEYDLMCYSDTPNNPTMIIRCAASSHDTRLDCNHDDYYNTNPASGSYLATHWNAANNQFLISTGGTPPPPPPVCSDAAFEPDDSAGQARSVSTSSNEQHAFCAAGDEDWVKFNAAAGTSYRIDTLSLASGVDTWIDLYESDGSTLIASDDDGAGGLSSLVTFTADVAGVYYVQLSDTNGGAGVANTYNLRIAEVDDDGPVVTWSAPVGNDGTFDVWQGGANVSLAAGAQDASGVSKIEFLRWNATSGTYVEFAEDASAPYSASLQLASLQPGGNEIVARATDVNGATGQASITIDVNVNTPPVAAAGSDQTVDDTDSNGTQAVTLNGADSYDPDGSITAWKWMRGTQSVGASASVTTTLPVGQNTLSLTVTDNRGMTATDTVVVTVRAVGKVASVSAITFTATKSGSSYRLAGSVTAKSNGAVLSSAQVAVRITYPNGSTVALTATTNSSGVASYSRTVSATGVYTLEVTGVSKSGYTYDSSANVVSSRSVTAGSGGGGGASMSVSAISFTRTTISGGYRLNAGVTIRSNGAAVKSANVTIEITYPNGAKATLSATTNTSGVASFSRTVSAKGTYTLRVTNVAKSGSTYNSAGNAVSSKSLTIT